MPIFFITGNKDKFQEANQIIPDLEQLELDLPEIQSLNPEVIISAKLKAAKNLHNGELIVEDTSLNLEGMNNFPGPLIKWLLNAIDNNGIYNICSKLNSFKAIALVKIGYLNKNGETKFFEGKINGQIVEPRGKNGFGWDPIFQPESSTKTFAEMNSEEKNKISMRRIAFNQLKKYLDQNT